MTGPWIDDDGDGLHVMPGGRSGLRLSVNDSDEGVFVDDLERFVFWLYEQAGRIAPVMLGRPMIDSARAAEWAGHQVRLKGGKILVGDAGGEWMTPAETRMLAALACSYADAAEAPDPDVERMAALFTECSRMAPEDAARYLLGKGVTLTGGETSDGQ